MEGRSELLGTVEAVGGSDVNEAARDTKVIVEDYVLLREDTKRIKAQ